MTTTWPLQQLTNPPKFSDDPDHSMPDVKAIFYEGLPWQGKPTRVFAYYGCPELAAGRKVPAMVLVHGGGGSAFVDWVRLWVKRGYAAIAMDTCGCISGGGHQNHARHEFGGPPGWGGFDQITEPLQDQWTYHAVADVILAHSLLHSFPEVDAENIGITGISWGGYLTCIAASIDARFKFAAPVYGCGFLGDNSTWLEQFKKMGSRNARQWLKTWDPSVFLSHTKIPFLWVTGTNDFAFPMDSLQKSYRRSKAPRTLCLRVDMPHGHGGHGENPEEILAMANAHCTANAIPLAHITAQGRKGARVWVSFESQAPIVKAELNYTTDTGPWQQRKWQSLPANLNEPAQRVSGQLPEGTHVYYFNIMDDRNLVVSSEHKTL